MVMSLPATDTGPHSGPRATSGRKAAIIVALARGSDSFDALRVACHMDPRAVMATLAALRRDGLVSFHDAHNSAGITGLRLTTAGHAAASKAMDAGAMAAAGGSPTLSPVVPRPTRESSVVRVRTTGRHGVTTSGESGPPVVIRAATDGLRDDLRPTPVPDVTPTPEPAPEPVSDPLAAFPLIADLMDRDRRRGLAMEAAEALDRAGLDDLATAAMAAVPDDTPLEQEVVRFIRAR
jgi:hypothetical protein